MIWVKTSFSVKYAWDKLGDDHAETCPLRVARPLSDAEFEEVVEAEESEEHSEAVTTKPKEDWVPEKFEI